MLPLRRRRLKNKDRGVPGTPESNEADVPSSRALVFLFVPPRGEIVSAERLTASLDYARAKGFDVINAVFIRPVLQRRYPDLLFKTRPELRAEGLADTLAESEVYAPDARRLVGDDLLDWLRAGPGTIDAIIIEAPIDGAGEPLIDHAMAVVVVLWLRMDLPVHWVGRGAITADEVLALYTADEAVGAIPEAPVDGSASARRSAPAYGLEPAPQAAGSGIIGARRRSSEAMGRQRAPQPYPQPWSAAPPPQPNLPVGSREDPLPHDGLYIRRNNAYSVKSSPRIADLIDQGTMPEQIQISFDDFLATDDARVPGPAAGEAVAVSHGFGPAPEGYKTHDNTTHFLEIAIKTAAEPAPGGRPQPALPVNFIFVIDTSSSMAGEKLDQVKTAIRELHGRLRDTDVLGLVTFDTQVRTLLKATPKADIPASRLAELVGGLRANGGTDINLGIRYGINEIRRHSGRQHVNCVYVFSDGDPTSGETDWIRIRADVASLVRGDVAISCFGFGSDARMRELDALAGLSGGHSRFVTHADDVWLDLAEDLTRRDHLAAVNVQLKIEIPAELAIWHLYGHDLITDPAVRAAVREEARATGRRAERDYGTAPLPALIEDEDGIRVFTPDLAFGETYWMVFELQAAPGAEPAGAGSATVQFLDTVTRANKRIELPLDSPGRIPGEAVRSHALGLRTSEVTFYAIDDLYQNDLDTAKTRLTRHADLLGEMFAQHHVAQFQDDQVTVRKLISLAGNLGRTISWDERTRGGGPPAIYMMNAFAQYRGGHIMMTRRLGVR